MVAVPTNSGESHEEATSDNVVVGPCCQSINNCLDVGSDGLENSVIRLIADDNRDISPSSNLRNSEDCITSEGPSMHRRSSFPRTPSKLSVVTTNHEEDNERTVENDFHNQSPKNSLVDDLEESPIDDETKLPVRLPPPPPPPPPPSSSISSSTPRHHHPNQHKFYLRQPISPIYPIQRIPVRRLNRISLHIYDLISSDALMQLPWGCVCEIGKCFNEVNSALHELGTGAYHVGIECNGIEYAYGACSQPNKTGVFSCIPKLSPGYQYRTSIDFGYLPLIRSSWVILASAKENDPTCTSPRSVTSNISNNFQYQEEFVDGRLVIKEMAAEYMGIDYDILKRNCCTFAADACVRLGVPEEDVPTWFRNLAETGAYSHTNFVEPLQHVLSGVSQPQRSSSTSSYHSPHNYPSKDYKSNYYEQYGHNATHQQHNYMYVNNSSNNCHNVNDESEPGFEVIAKRNASDTRDVVVVIDAAASDTYAYRSFRHFRKSVTTLA